MLLFTCRRERTQDQPENKMTTYTIQFKTSNFTLNFTGEKFKEGAMFDIEHFDRVEDARSSINENNDSECLPGSWFTITQEVFDAETEEVEESVIEKIQSIS